MIFGDWKTLPKIQLAIIMIVVAYFFTLGMALSAAYGGVISLVNTGLVNRHTSKQKQALAMSPQASVGLMIMSVIIRMLAVIGLVLVGLGALKLNANALIIGLVFGVVGFLIDKVRQK